MCRAQRALAMFAVVGACAGCVNVERRDYPGEWSPAAVTPGTCPTLTATYENHDRGSRPVPFARWVLPKTTYPLDSISRFRIEGPTLGRLKVVLWDGKGVIASREWRVAEDLKCADGWLEISGDSTVVLAPLVASDTRLRLALTAAGDLVVERDEKGGGIALVVPLVSMHRDWHLYARVPD